MADSGQVRRASIVALGTQHTGGDTTGTVYFEPDRPNDMRGGFKCQPGHCAKRNIDDFDHFMRGLIALRKQKEAA
ncbi:hypothetical protein MASR1M42_03620 [Azonexus hydrophilus]